MIQILETLVKVQMTLPECRVLKKVLGTVSRAQLANNQFSENEAKCFEAIYTALADFVDDQNKT